MNHRTLSVVLLGMALCFGGGISISLAEEGACKVGDHDSDGNLIFYCYHRYGPAILKTDYGFLLSRNEFGEPRFIVAQRNGDRIDIYGLWDDLLNALKKLPKKSEIKIYDRCTVPPFYSYYPLEEAMMAKVRKDFERAGVNTIKGYVEVCTCDESGVEWRLPHNKSLQPGIPREPDS